VARKVASRNKLASAGKKINIIFLPLQSKLQTICDFVEESSLQKNIRPLSGTIFEKENCHDCSNDYIGVYGGCFFNYSYHKDWGHAFK
jgi:hypothetical protein